MIFPLGYQITSWCKLPFYSVRLVSVTCSEVVTLSGLAGPVNYTGQTVDDRAPAARKVDIVAYICYYLDMPRGNEGDRLVRE